MTNTPFAKLASQAPRAVAPGVSPAEALSGFHAAMRDEEIPAGLLSFSGYPAGQAVKGCSLICDAGVLSIPAPAALVMLSGSGPGYSGLLDSCASSLPHAVLASVREGCADPAPVGRQVGLCVRLLDAPLGTLAPSVHLAIQRRLSSILLENPAFLHPSFLVPRRNGDRTEFVSLSSALASSAQGALPRYCHFHPDEPPPASLDGANDQTLIARLIAFSRNPCVRWALAEKCVRVEGANPIGGRCLVSVKHEVLLQALVRTLSPRPEFLASVVELDELAFPRLRAEKALPFAHTIATHERWKHQMVPLLARSTFAAFGTQHSHLDGVSGWTPFHRRDAWWLSAVRCRGPELSGLVARSLGGALQRWLFQPNTAGTAPRLAEQNLDRVVAGLVDCGIADGPLAASAFVAEYTIGRLRPEGRLPPTTPPQALAFLSGLERHGAGPLAMAQLSGALEIGDAGPHSADWQTAVDAIEIERRMGALLNATPAAIPAPPHGSAAAIKARTP